MRRNVVILLKFTRLTGHLHPHLRAVFSNYCSLLMALSPDQERDLYKHIAELGEEAGSDWESYAKLLQQISEQK